MADSTQSASRPRKLVDWEAVERDYRTGQFTLRELQAKHGPAYATIGQRARREGWTQDLRRVIRTATHAKLAESLVAQATHAHAQATQALTQSTISAAAEQNVAVIQRHRGWLRTLAEDAAGLRAKLVELSADASDVREVATAVSAVESLTRTTRTLIEKEREAYLIDAEPDKARDQPPQDWASMDLAQCQSALLGLLRAANG